MRSFFLMLALAFAACAVWFCPWGARPPERERVDAAEVQREIASEHPTTALELAEDALVSAEPNDETPPARVVAAERAESVVTAASAFKSLDVEVRGPWGEARAGVVVRIASASDSEQPIEPFEVVTDSNGRAVFSVPIGRYTLRARDESIRAQGRAAANVQRDRRVVLVLLDDEPQLAASGIVVDENGRGLAGVHVRVRGVGDGRSAWATTSAEGAFEIRMRPTAGCRQLEVAPESEPHVTEFAPNASQIAFGTTGLEFRRTGLHAADAFRIHVLDATSRAEIDGTSFVIGAAQGDGPRRIFHGDEGWIDVRAPMRDDVTWSISAPGYIAARALAAELRARMRDGVLEVELSPVPSRLDRASYPR